MQVTDDNFDDLFQRAAEDYPLKTDNGNWDSVDARLNKNAFPQNAKQRRKWLYAALLLLLLTGAFFIIIDYSNNSSKIATTPLPEQKALPADKESNKANVKPSPATGIVSD